MLLKLTEIAYQGDNIYKYGETVLVDTTQVRVYPAKRLMYGDRSRREEREVSGIRFANGDMLYVKENLDKIWAMIQEQKG